MSYLWGEIDRATAEEKLSEGGITDGKFLVRSRGAAYPKDYVLCVGYKGKPTHHLVTPNEDGVFTVNKKAFAGATTIKKLVILLKEKQPGWPVPLVKPVKNPDAVAAMKAKKAGKDKTLPKSKPAAAAPTPAKGSVRGKKDPGWLHGAISKDEACELLEKAGMDNGTYLVRRRQTKNEFVLSLVYKGQATHHLIAKNEEGFFAINKKTYDINAKKLSELVNALQQPLPKFPQQLLNAVNHEGFTEGATAPPKEDVAAPEPEPEEAATPKPEEAAPPSEPAAEPEPVAKTANVAAAEPEPVAKTANVAAAEPEDGGVGIEVTRVLARAVINLGNKLDKYESIIDTVAQQLQALEKFAVEQQTGGRRKTFADLDTSLFQQMSQS